MALLLSRRKDSERPWMTLHRQTNRLFEDFFGRDYLTEPFRGLTAWSPALDMAQTDDAIIVKAELPGLETKDVEVELTGDVLTIKGEKKEVKEEKAKSYHRVERCYGSFQRSVRLPAAVKGDEVDASFKNGVLTVSLPKIEESKTRSVKIKVE